MRALHEEAGARFGTIRGAEVARSYGDPATEYEAAVGAGAVRDRSHRSRLRIAGRSPAQMLTGVVTGRMPGPPVDGEGEALAGRAEPSAVLTPKGRVVSVLRLWREPGEDEILLLDVPASGAGPLAEHFSRYLPPRFASVEDVTGSTGMLSFLGPEAPDFLSREALGLRVGAEELEAMAEGDLRRVEDGPVVIRTAEVATPAWDVVADRAAIRTLWTRAVESGLAPVGSGVWEALRLEAGRPVHGDDFGTDTLLPETGLEARLVDGAKGCYTGQEVVVRIRDRGHVNRHLRRLRLGDGPAPPPGTELWVPGTERPVGTITSVADSPRMGTLALAYVRREVEPPGPVRVSEPEGREALVEEIRGPPD